jgi:ABC-type transport system involved in Fe-S cluster assembly fused permease/ATPase subunit
MLHLPTAAPAGALNRVIDRGTRGINWTLSSMVFNVVPTFFEVGRGRRHFVADGCYGVLLVIMSFCCHNRSGLLHNIQNKQAINTPAVNTPTGCHHSCRRLAFL